MKLSTQQIEILKRLDAGEYILPICVSNGNGKIPLTKTKDLFPPYKEHNGDFISYDDYAFFGR